MRGGIVLALLLTASLAGIPGPVGAEDPAPYVVKRQFDGFLTCAAATPVVSVNACALVIPEPFLFEFTVSEGLTEVVVGVAWTPTSPTAETFSVLFENSGCGGTACDHQYASVEGGSPVVFQVADEDITDPAFYWSAINGTRDLQVRVFPGGDVGAFFQQPFDVRVEEYYYQSAPQDRNPFDP